MLSLRPLLTGLLSLLLAACSSADPAPAPPALEGTWLEQSLETNKYRADGSSLSLSGPVPISDQAIHTITASLIRVKTPGSETLYDYKRNGNELTLYPRSVAFNAPFIRIVADLSTTALVLQDRRNQASGGYILYRFHYVRQ